MKNLYSLWMFFAAFCCFSAISYAQVPQKFGYQAIARDAGGIPLANTAISVRLNINNLTAGGATLYSERHDVTTNAQGLFSLEAGVGTILSGSIAAIDWATGDKFLETSLDSNGATGGYTFIVMGATQLISVPYSLNSNETRWVKASGTNLRVGDTGYPMNTNLNTAIGKDVLQPNTTGFANTGVGSSALQANTTGSYNSALGENALRSNISGNQNVAVGNRTLRNNTAGSYNAALGDDALFNNTGSSNAAFGNDALYYNTTGSSNTATGNAALLDNTTGNSNVADGKFALSNNSSGSFNTALGADANVGSNNLNNATAIGANALVNASNSMVLGSIAGVNGATESTKVGIGTTTPASLLSVGGLGGPLDPPTAIQMDNTYLLGAQFDKLKFYLFKDPTQTYGFGLGNVADVQYWAGSNAVGKHRFFTAQLERMTITDNGNVGIGTNTPGSKLEVAGGDALINGLTVGRGPGGILTNTVLGVSALSSNTTGFDNTANGASALVNNSTGSYNTASGFRSLYGNTTGSYNSAIGMWSLYDNSTTNGNTALGFSAGDYSTGAINCTMIGRGAGNNADIFTNSTALGYLAPITGDNQVNIGNTAVGSIKGQVGFTTYSDQRFKTNVQPNVAGLDFIMQLRPVTYRLDAEGIDAFLRNGYTPRQPDEDSERLHREGLKKKSSVTYTGFLAQEVETAAKKTGFDFSGVDKPQNERDLYGLRYAEFVVPLVKAVQEQQQMIEELKKEITLLKEQSGKNK